MTRPDLANERVEQGPYNFHGTPLPGLSKLIEELGELSQVCGKLIATNGEGNHWAGPDLFERFQDEAGDVLAALSFAAKYWGQVDVDIVNTRADMKMEWFERWHKGADE